MRAALALAALLLAASPIVARPAKAEPVAGGARFASGDRRIEVVALDAGIVRVRIATAAIAMGRDESWAVGAAMRAARAPVTPRPDGFDTARLSVRVDPASLRLTIRDLAGAVLLDDAADPVVARAAGYELRKAMPAGARVLGLGDKTGGYDRAGQTFTLWNTDAYGFGRATDPIYKAIPFFVLGQGDRQVGVLLDNTHRTGFDFGHLDPGTLAMRADGGAIDYYVIAGPTLREVVRGYARLTGTAPHPPRWTLGYQQSRYSYMSSAEVRALVDRFDAERFPLDAVWFDIDFQDRNRPFTVNRTTFPDFEALLGELKARGVMGVPIVDLHIAAAPGQGYAPYDSGSAGDHWVKRGDGQPYVAPVWPGPSVFPDFSDARTRAWWGPLFAPLVRAGVGGIWNDMNEPAIFDTPSKTMPLDNRHRVGGDGMAPRVATHAEIHNVYGLLNSRATYEGLRALDPARRAWVMTRATYAGGQRYAVTWTGDNGSTFDHLRLSVSQLLNLGLSGFAWSGVDVGGFTGGASPELMTRWFQYAAFMPIFRDHSGSGAPRAEPWVDGPAELAIRRRAVEERYALLPYLDQLADEASRTGDPVMRPIDYDHPGPMACDAAMSFTLGGRLLVAGNPNPESRQPYAACLPKGRWFDWRRGTPVDSDGKTAILLTPRHDELPVYVQAGAIIPVQPPVLHSRDAPRGPLALHVYPGPDCRGALYDDDGISAAGAVRRQAISCSVAADGAVLVRFAAPVGGYRPWWRRLALIVHGAGGERRVEIAAPGAATTVRIPAA